MHVPVLIVGAGPVGLALAADLGWRGISCLVVEQRDGSIQQPRMDAVGIRTMEYCRRWGITPWVENSPYPRDHPQDNVYVTSLRGYELGREPMSALAEAVAPPQSPAHRERCPQDMFDPILRRFAESFPEVTLRYRCEATEFNDDGDQVVTRLRDSDGSESTVTADYLVGCDGARSVVREGLGITLSGQGTLTYTTNVVFRCENLGALHDKAAAYRFIFIGTEGTWATLVAINGRDRWRFSLIGDERPREWSTEEIDAAIRRAVGRDFDFEIESVVPWVRCELIADTYQRGRILIAGDAAHMMSPTGGFGMNTGIDDAVDLSWKLEAVFQGWGGPCLLESYTDERRPVAVRRAMESTVNLKAMLSPRGRVRPTLLVSDGDGQRARDELRRRITEAMKPEWFSLGLHLGLRYDRSPICVPDGTSEPPSPVMAYQQTARPGGRAPHVWLRDGRSTLDLFGRAFVLLRLGRTPPMADNLLKVAADRGVPVRVVAIDQWDVCAAYQQPLVLVRPDGYVAWRGDREPWDARLLIDVVRGSYVVPPEIMQEATR